MTRSSARNLTSSCILQVFSTAENRILGYVVGGCVIAFALFYFVFRHK